jgi:hypothetical protein
MAHFTKFGKAATGHMFAHYERAKDVDGNYIKLGNQDIDYNRTQLNYNLAPMRESQGDFVRQRCGEVQCLNRKDVKVMCSWIVTAPKSVANTENERQFFQETYNFLSEKYGNENVVSACVHKDEVTPHMHFAFIPIVEDKKKKKLKVSAKECVGVNDLKAFHRELDSYLSKRMEKKYGNDILNEATREGNKSIEELKRRSAIEKMSEALPEIDVNSIGRKVPVVGMVVKPDEFETLKKGYKASLSIKELESKLEDAKNTINAYRIENDVLKHANFGLKYDFQKVADGEKFYLPKMSDEVIGKVKAKEFSVLHDKVVDRYYTVFRDVYASALKVIEAVRRQKAEVQAAMEGAAVKAWGRVRSVGAVCLKPKVEWTPEGRYYLTGRGNAVLSELRAVGCRFDADKNRWYSEEYEKAVEGQKVLGVERLSAGKTNEPRYYIEGSFSDLKALKAKLINLGFLYDVSVGKWFHRDEVKAKCAQAMLPTKAEKHVIGNAPREMTDELREMGCKWDKKIGWYHGDAEAAERAKELINVTVPVDDVPMVGEVMAAKPELQPLKVEPKPEIKPKAEPARRPPSRDRGMGM